MVVNREHEDAVFREYLRSLDPMRNNIPRQPVVNTRYIVQRKINNKWITHSVHFSSKKAGKAIPENDKYEYRIREQHTIKP